MHNEIALTLIEASEEHLDPPHTKLEKVTAVLKKPFEHHHHGHSDRDGIEESVAIKEADRKDKTTENWMG